MKMILELETDAREAEKSADRLDRIEDDLAELPFEIAEHARLPETVRRQNHGGELPELELLPPFQHRQRREKIESGRKNPAAGGGRAGNSRRDADPKVARRFKQKPAVRAPFLFFKFGRKNPVCDENVEKLRGKPGFQRPVAESPVQVIRVIGRAFFSGGGHEGGQQRRQGIGGKFRIAVPAGNGEHKFQRPAGPVQPVLFCFGHNGSRVPDDHT